MCSEDTLVNIYKKYSLNVRDKSPRDNLPPLTCKSILSFAWRTMKKCSCVFLRQAIFLIRSMCGVRDYIPGILRSRVVYKFTFAQCNASYTSEANRHFSMHSLMFSNTYRLQMNVVSLVLQSLPHFWQCRCSIMQRTQTWFSSIVFIPSMIKYN